MAGAGAEVFVQNKIHQRPVILFSKSYCPESRRIKQLITDEYKLNKKAYEAVDVERRQDVNQIEDYFMIMCLSDRREFPQLWVGGEYIGSEVKITQLHEEGKLYGMFQNAGVESSKPETTIRKQVPPKSKIETAEDEIRILKELGVIA